MQDYSLPFPLVADRKITPTRARSATALRALAPAAAARPSVSKHSAFVGPTSPRLARFRRQSDANRRAARRRANSLVAVGRM
jgi:hypothetical protein